MRCPHCRGDNAKVTNSRQRGDNLRIRSHSCPDCKNKFVTTEVIGRIGGTHPLIPTLVIKKGGKTEPFDREKLLQSIRIAVRKTQRGAVPIDDFVDEIEREVTTAIDAPTETRHIGDLIMEKLRHCDKVAYLRYASIHRELDSEKAFRDLLNDLSTDEKTRRKK